MSNSKLWSNSSSTASKFNLRSVRSRIQSFVELTSYALPCLLLAFLVFYVFQSGSGFFGVLIVTLFFRVSLAENLRQGCKRQFRPGQAFFCNSSGDLSFCETRQWKILQQSKITPWGCCLLLKPLAPSITKPVARRVWIYADMLEPNQYRHLCRIINRCRDHANTLD
ncbi:protein YgfX [Thalassotalea litorea]